MFWANDEVADRNDSTKKIVRIPERIEAAK